MSTTWKSPTIFGAVFESTLNPETRRSGGMHYTSIENIHKVIDPLFLDGLKKRTGGDTGHRGLEDEGKEPDRVSEKAGISGISGYKNTEIDTI